MSEKPFIYKLVCASLFCAMSVVLGKFLSIKLLTLRISFESLPIILCSLYLGPLFGLAAGILADLLGCLIMAYTVNPLITLGCALMGIIPYFVMRGNGGRVRLFFSVVISHTVASMAVKTAGLLWFYGGGVTMVLTRVVTYVIIAAAEGYLTTLILPALKRSERK